MSRTARMRTMERKCHISRRPRSNQDRFPVMRTWTGCTEVLPLRLASISPAEGRTQATKGVADHPALKTAPVISAAVALANRLEGLLRRTQDPERWFAHTGNIVRRSLRSYRPAGRGDTSRGVITCVVTPWVSTAVPWYALVLA